MTKLLTAAEIVAQLNKTFGDDSTSVASSEVIEDMPSISTGSFALDEATGIWGIPKGRIVQIAGAESSGKTMLALSCIAQAQKADSTCVCAFVDAEFTFTKQWAEMHGVDTDRLILKKENRGANIFDWLCGVENDKGKKSKPGLLDAAKAGELNLGIVVIDSVAAIIPPQEVTNAAGKATIALLPRFLGPELRKVTPMLDEANTTLIFINQVRVQPGVMYGDPETSPGGSALKHFITMMLHVAKLNGKQHQIFAEDGETKIGHRVQVRLDKNKVAPPHRKARFDIEYLKGVVNHWGEAVDVGIRYGIIARPNNVTYVYGDEKFKGRDSINEYFKNNPRSIESVKKLVKEKLESGEGPVIDVIEEGEN